jgi:RND superfamily putative drug exporter
MCAGSWCCSGNRATARDAIVIRTLLVPALVALFGRWNWWMPQRLGRLLRVPPTRVPATE